MPSYEKCDLPRWRSHKVVKAAKITQITQIPFDKVELYFDTHPAPAVVTREWAEKYHPYVGGYFIQYQDDYRSYSPAKAFEEGYTRITD